MAIDEKTKTSGSSTPTPNAGEGTDVTLKNSATSTTGADVVKPPTDAAPGQGQAGDMAAVPASTEQTKEKPAAAGFPVKVIKDNHIHEGQAVKKNATVMVDIATYRWMLENKVGEPGNADDVGKDVTKKGDIIEPETDEEAIKRLEAGFATKKAE